MMHQILEWILNNPDRTFAWCGGICILAWRAIPEVQQAQLEEQYPRLANLFRVIRAIGPDVLKGVRASKNLVNGKPWREDEQNQ
jgi:hypothetical protein